MGAGGVGFHNIRHQIEHTNKCILIANISKPSHAQLYLINEVYSMPNMCFSTVCSKFIAPFGAPSLPRAKKMHEHIVFKNIARILYVGNIRANINNK